MLTQMHRFACYDEYMADFEQAKSIYTRMLKNKAFRGFIERTQHATNDLGNAGLRELMIEPLQRIPRYRLLMNNLMKEMPTSSVQYQRLHEATSLAGHIASREVNNATRRAAILWSCSKVIDKFPAELATSRRELLGCIDVDEQLAETHSGMLHALGSVLGRRRTAGFSLLLLDDTLVLAQRHSHTPTHQLLRVQEPEKLVDEMQAEQTRSPAPGRRHELSFAGMIDLNSVLATGLDGSQARLAFLGPLRGSSNKAMTRVFADANSTRTTPRMAYFLDCLWKAQAVHRARSRAMQVRASVVPAAGERPAHVMLWTILSPAQFQRFPHKRNLLFQIGSVPSARELQHTYHIDTCVNIEPHPDEARATVTVLRPNGARATQVVALDAVAPLCADFCCGLVALPEVPEKETPAAEVPVRRAKSLRTPSRRGPGAHRARSFMSERVRASIQSSLEAVMESQEHETPPLPTSASHKRGMPLGEISNMTPKRRAVSKAPSETKVPTEEELVEEYQRMDTQPAETSPTRNALTMRAEESKEFPNPFDEPIDVHGTALTESERMDEAEVEAQLDEPQPEPVKSPMQTDSVSTASLPHDDLTPITEEASKDAREAPASPALMQLDPSPEGVEASEVDRAEPQPEDAKPAEAPAPVKNPAPVESPAPVEDPAPVEAPAPTEAPAPAEPPVVEEPAAAAEAPAAVPPAGPTKTPEPATPAIDKPLPDSPASERPQRVASRAASRAASRPASRPASRATSRGSQHQVTEEEMQQMLRPLLGRLQDAPTAQSAVHVQEVDPLPEPQHAEIEGREADMDLTILRLLQEEQARDGEPSPMPASEAGWEPDTPLLPSVLDVPSDNESLAMKRAMTQVNEAIAGLRKHRPSAQATGWQEDWARFKLAVKRMNTCWTRMERAYEDKQMDLAALRLAQKETDPTVRVAPEEYLRLEDEANMVLPLRIQVEQLTQKVESLLALEQDTRMENAELYDVFNEELSHLYKHSFRPANEEIEALRHALLAAKTELHQVRVENRALRQQCALASAT